MYEYQRDIFILFTKLILLLLSKTHIFLSRPDLIVACRKSCPFFNKTTIKATPVDTKKSELLEDATFT